MRWQGTSLAALERGFQKAYSQVDREFYAGLGHKTERLQAGCCHAPRLGSGLLGQIDHLLYNIHGILPRFSGPICPRPFHRTALG